MTEPLRPFRTAPIAPMGPVHGPRNTDSPIEVGARNPLIGFASASGLLAVVCILYGQIVGF
jgi:hypothetical protein